MPVFWYGYGSSGRTMESKRSYRRARRRKKKR